MLARSSPPLAAVAVALLLTGGVAENVWVTAEDEQAAADADAAVKLYCKEVVDHEVDKESGRDELESAVGGENMVQTILEAESQDEMADKAAEVLEPAKLFFNVGALVFAFILTILWWFCCWSCCPCCKCCRCCAKERKTNFFVKIMLFVVGAGIILGVIIAASVGTAGYGQVVDGFDTLACSAATLLKAALSGQANSNFIGFMPMLNVFYDMETNLDHDAAMMVEVQDNLDATDGVSVAMTLASHTMELLKDILENKMPPEIQENGHECELCTAMLPVLSTAISLLDSGVGSQLNNVRDEVKNQLGPDESKELQGIVRSASEPLTEVKDLLRSTLSFFTDTEKFLQLRGHLDGDGPKTMYHMTNSVVVEALFLSIFMVITLLCFVMKEHSGPANEDGHRPYNKWVHRCACCNWCSSWWFAIWAFFTGGLMLLLTVPMGGMCLVMDDMSSTMLNDVGKSLGVNLTGDSGDMINGIIDDCFVPVVRNSSTSLLDIIYTRDEQGNKEYLRKTMVEDVKNSIMSTFDALDDALAVDDVALADNLRVQDVVNMLANPVDGMILVADSTFFSNDPDYKDLFDESSLGDLVQKSSIKCSRTDITADFPVFGGDSVLGVDGFVTALENFGTRQSSRNDCADEVTCSAASGTTSGDACRAANKFVQAKQTLMDLTTFRCDVFVDPDDGISDCDPLTMTLAQQGGWSHSCVFPDGTVQKKEKPCNLAEFVTYVHDYQTRINATFKRVDKTVETLGPTISNSMRDTVSNFIVKPIDQIGNGLGCAFLGDAYADVVNGLCYQGVLGFRAIGKAYVGCAVMALMMVILTYSVWRRTIDNVNAAAKSEVIVANSYQP